ncbi:alpha-lytic protease prodomain-containing protein [Streptomyces sp. 549]|uniref:carbohydrate-binding protein n=1 Tax=Streptomyces sp. 549 TaxID=3049076 RepID=UPI0024C30F19|nr:carbohydrate-binding protein [Streptomyces sp. 549]MDK1474951.1 alpha-lytic protease prodomain-containing protein [Streptomyces sp. 549]
MLHRHVTGACAAVIAVGALTLTGLPGTAAAQPAAAPGSAFQPASEAPPELLRAMQRDLDLTKAQAERRLVNEADAGAVAGALQNALADDFAGAWVQGADSSTLTVATTDASDVRTITAKGAKAEVVEHSLADLDAAKKALDKAAARNSAFAAPVWYVDVRTNSVVVRTAKPAAADAFVAAGGVDRELVRVVKSDEQPRALYDLRGGDAYYMGSGGRCSVGFPVTRGTQQGFATAGHCGRTGTSTSGFNRVAQGTFQGSSFPGNDYAWVATNSNWTATPYVKGAGGQNVQVAGSTQQAVGASICRSGSTTGWHCGTIQQHNTSVTYPEGTITGVTRTSVCAEPGDSGGAYISGSQAQGVTSGGSGNCRTGGTTYHQPVNPILQVYGLTLKTTTGPGDPGPGDPGEPGGTWAVGTVYKVGDRVTYGGATYRCLQAHQAQAGWTPPAVPALWQRV